MWLLLSLASAGELAFTTDRGGIGESTASAGAGHVILEAAVSATFAEPATYGTAGLVGRFGVAQGLELRLRIPDVRISDGDLSAGVLGLGFKVASSAESQWGVSAVPEVQIDPKTGDLSGQLGSNVSFSEGLFSTWAQGLVTWDDADIGLFVGLAVAITAGSGRIYINGGRAVNDADMIGAGGTLRLAEATQLDLGVDVFLRDSEATPIASLGVVVGF